MLSVGWKELVKWTSVLRDEDGLKRSSSGQRRLATGKRGGRLLNTISSSKVGGVLLCLLLTTPFSHQGTRCDESHCAFAGQSRRDIQLQGIDGWDRSLASFNPFQARNTRISRLENARSSTSRKIDLHLFITIACCGMMLHSPKRVSLVNINRPQVPIRWRPTPTSQGYLNPWT